MELFRFRIVRPIQAQTSTGLDITKISRPLTDPPPTNQKLPKRRRSAAPPKGIRLWLKLFSDKLASAGDLVSPDKCIAMLPTSWLEQTRSAAWANAGQDIVDNLTDALSTLSNPQFTIVESACRELLIYDLVASLAEDQTKKPMERDLTSASGVRVAVNRRVNIPDGIVPKRRVPSTTCRVGRTDFYTVHDEWSHYEPGEIAAVVNVLPGESFLGRVRHSEIVDTTTSTTTQTINSQLFDQQKTTSTSLSDSSTKDSSLNIGVQGQVETSGQYGPTHVDTNLGAQLQVSLSRSDSHALTTGYQTVQRAVNSVTSTVTTLKSQRTVTRNTKIDEHRITNSLPSVSVGIYRWLYEIHYVQVIRYPNRLILEFEIPEPGYWLKWALQHRRTDGWDNPDPGPFRADGATQDLSPSDITTANYTQLISKWRSSGVAPPPSPTIILSAQLSSNPPPDTTTDSANDSSKANETYVLTDTSLTVPDGYSAGSWSAQVATWTKAGNNGGEVIVTVGGSSTSSGRLQSPGTGEVVTIINGALEGNNGSLSAGGITVGVIPISVVGFPNLQGLTVDVNVTLSVTADALKQWQQQVFDALAASYQDLVNAFHQERDARSEEAGGIVDLTGPPELNQQRAVAELRKAVISTLIGQELPVGIDIDTDPLTGEPHTRPDTLLDTDIIQFFEQCFEWSNIVYICYPYYWGSRSRWVESVNSASADPVFDQFLSSGSARVVVPVRLGYEDLVNFYLRTGIMWNGSKPPAPDDAEYLSIAEEIESLQKGPTDGTPVGDSWRISLPTTLVWAGTDPNTLPTNPHPTIPPPPPDPPS